MEFITIQGRLGYGRGDEPTPQESFFLTKEVVDMLSKLPINATGKKFVPNKTKLLFISAGEAGYEGKTPAGFSNTINKIMVCVEWPFYARGGYIVKHKEESDTKIMGIKIVRTGEEFDSTLYATKENILKGIVKGKTASNEPSANMRRRVGLWMVENGYVESELDSLDDSEEIDDLEIGESEEIDKEVDEAKKE